MPQLEMQRQIEYILQENGWTEKELGASLSDEANGIKPVAQWQVSRWKNGKDVPRRGRRVEQIAELCYQTALKGLSRSGRLRYVCNLGKRYGEHLEERTDDALARLRTILIRECPPRCTGPLSILVFMAELPEGVHAQCFSSDEEPTCCYVIAVRDTVDWRTHVRDEIFAHVLPIGQPTTLEVKEQ